MSSSECLDAFYRPAIPVADRYRSYFTPLMLTDARGQAASEVADDIDAGRARLAARAVRPRTALPDPAAARQAVSEL